MNLHTLLEILMEKITLLGFIFLIAGLAKLFTYYKLFGVFIFEFIGLGEIVSLFANNLLGYFTLVICYAVGQILMPMVGNRPYMICSGFLIVTLIYFLGRKNVTLIELLGLNLYFSSSIYFLTTIQHTNLNSTWVLFVILISLLAYSIGAGVTEWHKVKTLKYYIKTKVYLDKEEILITTDDYCYIGKTNTYTFLCNLKTGETMILPNSRVSKFIFSHAK